MSHSTENELRDPPAGRSPEICIIGAGFAGLCIAIQLKMADIHSFVILEKAASVGGTWRDNTYPGAACDVPSHLYSFSFEPGHDWSRQFGAQPEILAYLEHCAKKYSLHKHIRFQTEVEGARFDDHRGQWVIAIRNGATGSEESVSARVLVSACGQLNMPAYPKIPGLDTFEGPSFHSARWNHQVELRDKTVATIGTGASAIQFVPEVAKRAKRLLVFQRSAPWILPKADRAFTAVERSAFARSRTWERVCRAGIYAKFESRALAFFGATSILRAVEWRAQKYLHDTIEDPVLRAQLTPDYQLGCKRILLSNDFYPSLLRANVTLVTQPIARVVPEGIVTEDEVTHPADALVFGTGFRSTDFLAPMKIEGRGGRVLDEVWREGAEAYKGISVAGFPNLFLLYGPNTNLSHNSIVFMIESQVHYILACLKLLRSRGETRMDVRPEAQADFNREIQSKMHRTAWASGCNSWYLTESGKNTNNWPGFTVSYRLATRRVDLAHYRFGS